MNIAMLPTPLRGKSADGGAVLLVRAIMLGPDVADPTDPNSPPWVFMLATNENGTSLVYRSDGIYLDEVPSAS